MTQAALRARFARVRKKMQHDPWDEGPEMLNELYEDALRAIASGWQEGTAREFAALALRWHLPEE